MDSVDPSRDNSNKAIQKRMDKYGRVDPADKEDPQNMPRWARVALIKKQVQGLSYNDAAEPFDRAGQTLANYARSEAAEKWLAPIEEDIEDPVWIASQYLKGEAVGLTMDQLTNLELAKRQGDVKEVRKILQDLMDRIGGELAAKGGGGESGGQPTVNIEIQGQLEGDVLDDPSEGEDVIESEYEIVEDDA